MNRRRIGAERERIAADFLRGMGYTILELNYRTRAGEIDIIAEDGGTLCFVEVKYRSSTAFGYPGEAVGAAKQKKIIAVSRYYMTVHHLWGRGMRYDVAEIIGDRIRVLKGCFEAGS